MEKLDPQQKLDQQANALIDKVLELNTVADRYDFLDNPGEDFDMVLGGESKKSRIPDQVRNNVERVYAERIANIPDSEDKLENQRRMLTALDRLIEIEDEFGSGFDDVSLGQIVKTARDVNLDKPLVASVLVKIKRLFKQLINQIQGIEDMSQEELNNVHDLIQNYNELGIPSGDIEKLEEVKQAADQRRQEIEAGQELALELKSEGDASGALANLAVQETDDERGEHYAEELGDDEDEVDLELPQLRNEEGNRLEEDEIEIEIGDDTDSGGVEWPAEEEPEWPAIVDDDEFDEDDIPDDEQFDTDPPLPPPPPPPLPPPPNEPGFPEGEGDDGDDNEEGDEIEDWEFDSLGAQSEFDDENAEQFDPNKTQESINLRTGVINMGEQDITDHSVETRPHIETVDIEAEIIQTLDLVNDLREDDLISAENANQAREAYVHIRERMKLFPEGDEHYNRLNRVKAEIISVWIVKDPEFLKVIQGGNEPIEIGFVLENAEDSRERIEAGLAAKERGPLGNGYTGRVLMRGAGRAALNIMGGAIPERFRQQAQEWSQIRPENDLTLDDELEVVKQEIQRLNKSRMSREQIALVVLQAIDTDTEIPPVPAVEKYADVILDDYADEPNYNRLGDAILRYTIHERDRLIRQGVYPQGSAIVDQDQAVEQTRLEVIQRRLSYYNELGIDNAGIITVSVLNELNRDLAYIIPRGQNQKEVDKVGGLAIYLEERQILQENENVDFVLDKVKEDFNGLRINQPAMSRIYPRRLEILYEALEDVEVVAAESDHSKHAEVTYRLRQIEQHYWRLNPDAINLRAGRLRTENGPLKIQKIMDASSELSAVVDDLYEQFTQTTGMGGPVREGYEVPGLLENKFRIINENLPQLVEKYLLTQDELSLVVWQLLSYQEPGGVNEPALELYLRNDDFNHRVSIRPENLIYGLIEYMEGKIEGADDEIIAYENLDDFDEIYQTLRNFGLRETALDMITDARGDEAAINQQRRGNLNNYLFGNNSREIFNQQFQRYMESKILEIENPALILKYAKRDLGRHVEDPSIPNTELVLSDKRINILYVALDKARQKLELDPGVDSADYREAVLVTAEIERLFIIRKAQEMSRAIVVPSLERHNQASIIEIVNIGGQLKIAVDTNLKSQLRDDPQSLNANVTSITDEVYPTVLNRKLQLIQEQLMVIRDNPNARVAMNERNIIAFALQAISPDADADNTAPALVVLLGEPPKLFASSVQLDMELLAWVDQTRLPDIEQAKKRVELLVGMPSTGDPNPPEIYITSRELDVLDDMFEDGDTYIQESLGSRYRQLVDLSNNLDKAGDNYRGELLNNYKIQLESLRTRREQERLAGGITEQTTSEEEFLKYAIRQLSGEVSKGQRVSYAEPPRRESRMFGFRKKEIPGVLNTGEAAQRAELVMRQAERLAMREGIEGRGEQVVNRQEYEYITRYIGDIEKVILGAQRLEWDEGLEPDVALERVIKQEFTSNTDNTMLYFLDERFQFEVPEFDQDGNMVDQRIVQPREIAGQFRSNPGDDYYNYNRLVNNIVNNVRNIQAVLLSSRMARELPNGRLDADEQMMYADLIAKRREAAARTNQVFVPDLIYLFQEVTHEGTMRFEDMRNLARRMYEYGPQGEVTRMNFNNIYRYGELYPRQDIRQDYGWYYNTLFDLSEERLRVGGADLGLENYRMQANGEWRAERPIADRIQIMGVMREQLNAEWREVRHNQNDDIEALRNFERYVLDRQLHAVELNMQRGLAPTEIEALNRERDEIVGYMRAIGIRVPIRRFENANQVARARERVVNQTEGGERMSGEGPILPIPLHDAARRALQTIETQIRENDNEHGRRERMLQQAEQIQNFEYAELVDIANQVVLQMYRYGVDPDRGDNIRGREPNPEFVIEELIADYGLNLAEARQLIDIMINFQMPAEGEIFNFGNLYYRQDLYPVTDKATSEVMINMYKVIFKYFNQPGFQEKVAIKQKELEAKRVEKRSKVDNITMMLFGKEVALVEHAFAAAMFEELAQEINFERQRLEALAPSLERSQRLDWLSYFEKVMHAQMVGMGIELRFEGMTPVEDFESVMDAQNLLSRQRVLLNPNPRQGRVPGPNDEI